ncbi:MAG: metallophosphoesterase [Eubacteriales bacterium]|nr:metallophosphoesterase [Eubacteriales bacterium]
MKFLVISDTHGKIEAAIEAFKSLKDIDQILHLGDYARDGSQLENKLGVPVVTVRGNMDGSYSNEDYRIIRTEFGKIYLSHGHMEAVKYSTHNLLYKAYSLGCKAALYGHTHVPMYENVGGIHLLNPGSLTMPKGGKAGSYSVIQTEQDLFKATILYWNDKRK